MITFSCDFKGCDKSHSFKADNLYTDGMMLNIRLFNRMSAPEDFFGFVVDHGVMFCEEHHKEAKKIWDEADKVASKTKDEYMNSVFK